jgi:hypothetical protein
MNVTTENPQIRNKEVMMNLNAKFFVLASLAITSISAFAQNGVQVINRAYQEAPPLPIVAATNSSFAGYQANGQRVWEVAMTDQTIRKALEKWSSMSGWTFNLEHWAVDRDLPVAAATSFQGDFRGAVRSLLASTELTDLPLQPCFYNNSVLRVVPRAELCDRMASNDR